MMLPRERNIDILWHFAMHDGRDFIHPLVSFIVITLEWMPYLIQLLSRYIFIARAVCVFYHTVSVYYVPFMHTVFPPFSAMFKEMTPPNNWPIENSIKMASEKKLFLIVLATAMVIEDIHWSVVLMVKMGMLTR